jgi:hypothetical protein
MEAQILEAIRGRALADLCVRDLLAILGVPETDLAAASRVRAGLRRLTEAGTLRRVRRRVERNFMGSKHLQAVFFWRLA